VVLFSIRRYSFFVAFLYLSLLYVAFSASPGQFDFFDFMGVEKIEIPLVPTTKLEIDKKWSGFQGFLLLNFFDKPASYRLSFKG